MKILLAPSKSQDPVVPPFGLPKRFLMDESYSRYIMTQLKSLDRETLADVMGIRGKLLDQMGRLIHEFGPRKTERTPALWTYTGVVYDQLTPNQYSQSQLITIDDHLRILSALYGLVHPFAPIWRYRLDFTMPLDFKLKAHWKPLITQALQHEDLIIDLSSHEFSGLLDVKRLNVHRVEFAQRQGDRTVIISTLAKQARGALAHQLILHGITDIAGMRQLTVLNYHVDEAQSTDRYTLFVA
jgi:cytoplasmic iron level regulating protein YaaA (DUF328/UPF0246 family)